ncbi:uncharacterized protein LOC128249895 [Octopus bimaculoides]|uniref:uncharacterized protein LOC128249895 n=1 Tax=Octopus bimaculoides TaxID=37653 RepID=UPI0022E3E2A4|nr:uncharacterized protein LOC128249895 [Octopus bimaculoides]
MFGTQYEQTLYLTLIATMKCRLGIFLLIAGVDAVTQFCRDTVNDLCPDIFRIYPKSQPDRNYCKRVKLIVKCYATIFETCGVEFKIEYIVKCNSKSYQEIPRSIILRYKLTTTTATPQQTRTTAITTTRTLIHKAIRTTIPPVKSKRWGCIGYVWYLVYSSCIKGYDIHRHSK